MSGNVPSVDWSLIIGAEVFFVVLLWTKKYIHYETRTIPRALIGANRVALYIYWLIMLPGVILHELSHALAALILFVNVQGIVISPTEDEGSVILGMVRHEKAGLLRSMIIGIAPLVAGVLIVLLIGALAFDLTGIYRALVSGDWPTAIRLPTASLAHWWGWGALYLIFTFSANMFPSSADLLPWMWWGLAAAPFLIAALAQLAAPLLPWLVMLVNSAFRGLTLILAFTIVVDIPMLLLLTASAEAIVKQFP